MKENFYREIREKLQKLQPTLLQTLQEREIEVRSKENNIYQVYWKKSVEKEFAETQTELVSILEDYEIFQDSIGKEVNEYLSLLKEKNVKSILNLFRMDVWFEKDVYSRFKEVGGKYYRFFKDNLQEEIFSEGVENEKQAKHTMIIQCRKEIVDSFHTKFECVEKYLKKEIRKLNNKLEKIKESKDKPSIFYNYGINIVKENPTIAMIILGVSVECKLKLKFRHFLRDSLSLGKIIGVLERRKRMTKHYNLLKDINDYYVKAKHEKDTLIPLSEVELFYQKSTFLF